MSNNPKNLRLDGTRLVLEDPRNTQAKRALDNIKLYNVRLRVGNGLPAGLDDVRECGDRRNLELPDKTVEFRGMADLTSVQLEAVRACRGLESFADDGGRWDIRTVEVFGTLKTYRFMESRPEEGLILDAVSPLDVPGPSRHYEVLEHGPNGQGGLEKETLLASLNSLERCRLLSLIRDVTKHFVPKGKVRSVDWLISHRNKEPRQVYAAPFLEPLYPHELESTAREYASWISDYLEALTSGSLAYYACKTEQWKDFVSTKTQSPGAKARAVARATPRALRHSPEGSQRVRTPSSVSTPSSRSTGRSTSVTKSSRTSLSDGSSKSAAQSMFANEMSPSPFRLAASRTETSSLRKMAHSMASAVSTPSPSPPREPSPQISSPTKRKIPKGYVWTWPKEYIPDELQDVPVLPSTWQWDCPLDTCLFAYNFASPSKWFRQALKDDGETQTVKDAVGANYLDHPEVQRIFRRYVHAHYCACHLTSHK